MAKKKTGNIIGKDMTQDDLDLEMDKLKAMIPEKKLQEARDEYFETHEGIEENEKGIKKMPVGKKIYEPSSSSTLGELKRTVKDKLEIETMQDMLKGSGEKKGISVTPESKPIDTTALTALISNPTLKDNPTLLMVALSAMNPNLGNNPMSAILPLLLLNQNKSESGNQLQDIAGVIKILQDLTPKPVQDNRNSDILNQLLPILLTKQQPQHVQQDNSKDKMFDFLIAMLNKQESQNQAFMQQRLNALEQNLNSDPYDRLLTERSKWAPLLGGADRSPEAMKHEFAMEELKMQQERYLNDIEKEKSKSNETAGMFKEAISSLGSMILEPIGEALKNKSINQLNNLPSQYPKTQQQQQPQQPQPQFEEPDLVGVNDIPELNHMVNESESLPKPTEKLNIPEQVKSSTSSLEFKKKPRLRVI